MIISASRRTDIPAFYSEWIIRRIRAGSCRVSNPFNPSQVREVSLRREDVDAFVFWSKNPAPMLPALDGIADLGYPFYFQLTLNPFPKDLEPGLPDLAERIETFRDLSSRIGPHRVVWRYDPIIISNITDHDFHARCFESLCLDLAGSTKRVMVSIVDFYKKTERGLHRVPGLDVKVEENDAGHPAMQALLGRLAASAKASGIEILSCAEESDLSPLGIRPGRCIDPEILRTMGIAIADDRKDPGQRKACLCVKSVDIGMTDTCAHGCVYCYSTRDHDLAAERRSRHDPEAAMLAER